MADDVAEAKDGTVTVISKKTTLIIGIISAIVGALVSMLTTFAFLYDQWSTWRVIKEQHLEKSTTTTADPDYNHEDLVQRITSIVDAKTQEAVTPLASRTEVPELVDLSPFALTEDLPSFGDFALKSDLPAPFDISNYISSFVPRGAVMAFDLSDECPDGWASFNDAAGRFIVGSGQGEGLQNRLLRAVGGEETHVLSISELPPQDITLPGVASASTVDRYNAGGRNYPVITTAQRDIVVGGSGTPISMLPPFIALRYCKKV